MCLMTSLPWRSLSRTLQAGTQEWFFAAKVPGSREPGLSDLSKSFQTPELLCTIFALQCLKDVFFFTHTKTRVHLE